MASRHRHVTVRGVKIRVIGRPFRKLLGRTYKGRGEIELDRTLVGIPRLSTLVHEMIHNLNWGLAEKRVQHLEYAVITMVMSNPELFRDITTYAPVKPRRRRR